jgi:hypothetical protein
MFSGGIVVILSMPVASMVWSLMNIPCHMLSESKIVAEMQARNFNIVILYHLSMKWVRVYSGWFPSGGIGKRSVFMAKA